MSVQVIVQWNGPVGDFTIPQVHCHISKMQVINFSLSDPDLFTNPIPPMIILNIDKIIPGDASTYFGLNSGSNAIASSIWSGGAFINALYNTEYTIQGGHQISGTKFQLSVLKGDGTYFSPRNNVTYAAFIKFY